MEAVFEHEMAIVAILKNEGDYIREWLDYHIAAGVTKFYLYDNDSEDSLRDILQPYIDTEIVDYTYFPGECMQLIAYNDALERHRFDCRYMAFIDADEFICPYEGDIVEVIHSIMKEVPSAGAVVINWRMYGSSGQEKKDLSHGVLERFRLRAKDDFEPNIHIKTVADPRRVALIDNPHFAIYLKGFHAIDEHGNPVVLSPFNKRNTVDRIRINHYFTKSREEWLEKRNRGRADAKGKRSLDEFEIYDNNDIYDDVVLKYWESRKGIVHQKTSGKPEIGIALKKETDNLKEEKEFSKKLFGECGKVQEIPWPMAVQCAKQNVGVTAEQGKIVVDMGSYMGASWARLDDQAHVLIGRYCSIGQSVSFCAGYDHDYRRVTTSPLWIHGLGVNDDGGRMRPRRNHILIGNDVWIGDGARIMGGVQVGNGAVIGAGAVVAKDVPPYAIVAGNPARVVKYRFSEEIIAKLQRIKFWRWPYEKFQENLPLMYDTEAFVEKYDVVVHEDESDLARQLKSERAKGTKVCFFHSDFGMEKHLWEDVLEQYALYAPSDFLLVMVSSGKDIEGELAAFRDKLQEYKQSKGMLVYKQLSPALYQNADFYLAGIDYETLECVDYASDYGVRILSALDEDMFHWCGGSRDYIGERIAFAKKTVSLPSYKK